MMSSVYSPSPHLVVCAHGLEGASNDLRQVRIFLQVVYLIYIFDQPICEAMRGRNFTKFITIQCDTITII